MAQTVLIVGDPIDGFQYIGPFPDRQRALMYADVFHTDADLWTTDLKEPQTENPSEAAD